MKKKLFENVGGNQFKLMNEGKELSPKSIALIEKWRTLGNREAAVKMIDSVLRQRVGLESGDLPDTSTFSNGLDEIEESLESNDYRGALIIAVETAKSMVEEEGGDGIF